jgi:hypothetical protein
VTASYAGDVNSASSSSSPVSLSVVDIVVMPGQSSLTVMRGKNVQTSLTVTAAPSASFNPTVTFACSGLPLEASCSFNPSSVTPNGAAMSTMLTIQTVAPSARLKRLFGRAELFYTMLLPGFIGAFLVKRNGKRVPGRGRLFGLVGALMLATLWWTACGGGSSASSSAATNQNSGTPVGSSTVTVTATSSGTSPISKQVTITVTVQ